MDARNVIQPSSRFKGPVLWKCFDAIIERYSWQWLAVLIDGLSVKGEGRVCLTLELRSRIRFTRRRGERKQDKREINQTMSVNHSMSSRSFCQYPATSAYE